MGIASAEVLNVSLESDLRNSLERYAELVGKSQSDIASEALDDYLSWRVPQVKALRQAIREADAGEFASDAEVDTFFNR